MDNYEQRSVEMICSPDLWMYWPVLPLKHLTQKDRKIPGFPATAYLIDKGPLTTLKKYEVYLGSIFTADTQKDPIVLEADTADEIVKAGWVVD